MIEGHDYTLYSKVPGGRARMYALLALVTAFLTPLAQHGVLVILRHYVGDDWKTAETALLFGGFTAIILFGVLLNLFTNYGWRTPVGRLSFRLAGLPVPPNLSGEYRGDIKVSRSSDPSKVHQTDYRLRIAQTWEQIMILAERANEDGSMIRAHSDMASIQIGMLAEVATLRFVYTFEETLPREDATGVMTRLCTGAAIFQFRHEDRATHVEGHFFDDAGRSGMIMLAKHDSAGLLDFGSGKKSEG